MHQFIHRWDYDLCSECGKNMGEGEHGLLNGVPPDTAPAPKERNHSAAANISHALYTYLERNKQYGNSYHKFGEIMMALFPNGLELRSKEDFNRYGVIFMMISKINRYTQHPDKGHLDSAHDLGVYSFMLEELDSIAQGLPVTANVMPKIDPNWCEHVIEGTGGGCIACGMAAVEANPHMPHNHNWVWKDFIQAHACSVCQISKMKFDKEQRERTGQK